MPHNRNRKLVLVVEDSPAQSIHLQAVLEREGIGCVLASNGQTGLYLAQALLPEAVILDLELPLLSGFDVCRELKSSPETADVPVILLTRFDDTDSVKQGFEMGAVEFIPKDSFADAVLLETLRQMNILPAKK